MKSAVSRKQQGLYVFGKFRAESAQQIFFCLENFLQPDKEKLQCQSPCRDLSTNKVSTILNVKFNEDFYDNKLIKLHSCVLNTDSSEFNQLRCVKMSKLD